MTYTVRRVLPCGIARNYPQPVSAKAVGRNLRAIRKARKENQEAVASRIGVPQERISEWETGRYESFDMKTLIRLAQGYGSTVEQLLVGVDESYDSHRDLLRHVDHGSSSAAHSQARREAADHENGGGGAT